MNVTEPCEIPANGQIHSGRYQTLPKVPHLADHRPLPQPDDGIDEDEVGLEMQGSKVRGRGGAIGEEPLNEEIVTVLQTTAEGNQGPWMLIS